MLRITTRLFAFLILFSVADLKAAAFVPKDIDERKGPKLYHLGNSHTDSIREKLCGLAGAAGHMDYTYGTHTIPGAPLRWLKNHPGKSFEQLKGHAWDVVTLQSYNSTTEEEIQAAIDYSKAAYEGNPKVRIIMYSIWPGDENWDEPTLGRREEWNEGVAKRIREAIPGIDVSVAPTSLIIRRLGNMADAGLIPGMKSRRDLYNDPGHMGPNGGYAICCAMYAMIFQKSPVGLPSTVNEVGGGRPREEVHFDVGTDKAPAIQNLVWDTLAEYPHDGVDTGMVVNSGRMPPAIVGRAYDQPLPVVNAPSEPEWSIISGKLPEGMKLENGRITGTPKAETKAVFTVQAKAGDAADRREVTLLADPDLPLTVPDQDMDIEHADDYVMTTLKAKGAIGRVTWEKLEGELPPGFKMVDSGLIMGTPGKPGTYEVSFQATDKHPDGPRTVKKTVTFKVGPRRDDVLAIKQAPVKLNYKGDLKKEDLAAFEPEHILRDSAGNEVGRFAVAWYKDPKKPKNSQLMVVARVKPDSTSPDIPNESVHVYIDMMHNRELIYNEDDVHVMTIPDSKSSRAETVQGYKRARSNRLKNPDGSWVAVFIMSGKFFAGRGVHTHFGPNITYGFNLAMGSKEDPEKRVYWRGSSKSDKDTSDFGSIVISE